MNQKLLVSKKEFDKYQDLKEKEEAKEMIQSSLKALKEGRVYDL